MLTMASFEPEAVNLALESLWITSKRQYIGGGGNREPLHEKQK